MPNLTLAAPLLANSLPRTRGYAPDATEVAARIQLSPAYAGVCRALSGRAR